MQTSINNRNTMHHIKKDAYKNFEGKDNIIFGDAELPYIPRLRAWAIPGGKYITNKQDALNYAVKMHKYITHMKAVRFKRKQKWYLQ